MSFFLPSPVERALFLLENAGYEAYLVGGCVRDMLRGAAPHDFDMATAARPEEMLAVFREYRTIETGIRHGTVTVLIEGMPLEITTYRTEGAYTDHRRPDSVSFSRSVHEDLARRDFTVNAMAYHPERGVFDPFGGRADLAAGIIRAVGDPYVRFEEDALRILRALRFSARFGFRVEAATAAAARKNAGTLEAIAKERIREELYGILAAESAADVLAEYADILSVVIPEGQLTERFSDIPPVPLLRIAEYLSKSGETLAVAALTRLRADRETIRRVETVIRLADSELSHRRADLCRLLRAVGEDALRDALVLRAVRGMDDTAAKNGIEAILRVGFPYRLRDLAVTGDDAVAAGIPRGPAVGRVLEELYNEVIEGRLENEAHALLAYLKKEKNRPLSSKM